MHHGQGTSSTASHLRTWLLLAAILLCGAAGSGVAGSIALADQPAPPPPPPIRETPSRSEISQVLGERAADVRGCAPPGTPGGGVVTVHVRFESSGTAQSVTVTSPTLPASVSACIVQAVQKARVAPFRAAEFNVNFPYRY